MPKFSLPDQITLAQGSGGTAMQALIEQLFRATFDNALLAQEEDQARISLETVNALGDRLALTTDSYVVTPLFFPGGDIGSLAVNGTVNDLAVGGAIPLYLTCGLILEEGLSLATLTQVIQSLQKAAIAAGVSIVTGDTKVVPRGSADQLFINTAGVG
ncbi:MAG: AIR synthase related protein, partial [Microcystaceae cyanobacterium]